MKCMYEALDDESAERRAETCKVYHHLFSPTGCCLITKGPGGLYPHHRGLFYGFNKISYGDGQTADVWHCRDGESQTHEETISRICGPVFGRDVNRIWWRGKDGEPFAEELREMTGLVPGSIPPFGHPILPFDLYVDTGVCDNRRIAFNVESATAPLPLVVRSRVASCISTSAPSLVSRTSTST